MSELQSTQAPRILVVDDEASARTALTELLREEGFAVRSAADGFKAIGQIEEWVPDLVITDVKMPGMDGLSLMRRVREDHDAVGIVVMTAFGSVENAVEAMHKGADDYLTKPVHFPELLVVVQRVLAHYELRRENTRLREAMAAERDEHDEEAWIGHAKASRDLFTLITQVADSDASVLVVGESGSGKGLVARTLHRRGRRSDAPFVTVRCAGLDERALDRELFGYPPEGDNRPGRSGRLAQAEGGILLLDEVGSLPPSVQVKLLRFLEDKSYERPGFDVPQRADVRIVATSTEELSTFVNSGRFREDLYYRLNIITLRVPTLRHRREDLVLLVTRFVRKYAKAHRKAIRGASDRALRALLNFDWPGNVAQLESCIERAVVICDKDDIEPRHLPREVLAQTRGLEEMPPIPGTSMAELERYAILKTLEFVRGSTSKAAEILGISPRKIQYRLAEYREAEPSGQPAVVADRRESAS